MEIFKPRRILGGLFLLSLSTLVAEASLVPPVAKIHELGKDLKVRVRIAEAIPKVSLRGFDLQIYQGSGHTAFSEILGNSRHKVLSADQGSQWEFRCQDGRIRAISAKAGRSFDLQEPVSVETPAGFLHFKDRPYRERVEIHSVGFLCEVVNEVSLEDYLNGLVNAEFNSKWSSEAIAAQIVAARTYALYQIRQARLKPDNHYDLDATIQDQVYDGSIKEDYRASLGVKKTRGLVLTLGEGREIAPLKAFYHSTCGGMTDLPENVWGSKHPGFKQRVVCPFCSNSPKFNWNVDVSSQELAQKIKKGASLDGAPASWPREWRDIVRDGKILDIHVQAADETARVSKLVSTWSFNGKAYELPMTGNQIRSWLGVSKFRSTVFELVFHRGMFGGHRWNFSGRGNGHGVGLCQWGAKVMGERGYSMASILKHYYPDAVLRKFW